jgi:hypothetical protein
MNKFIILLSISLELLFVFPEFPFAQHWVSINGPSATDISTLTINGNNLFAGTNKGVFMSTDNGVNWRRVNSGITLSSYVYCLAIIGADLFAGTNNGVFLSHDKGENWTKVNSGLTVTTIQSLLVNGTNIFAGTNDGRIFMSSNKGQKWNEIDSSLMDYVVNVLAVSGTDLFAGTFGKGVWRFPLNELVVKNGYIPTIKSDVLKLECLNLKKSSLIIHCMLPCADKVRITVYDLSGRSHASLVDRYLDAGTFRFAWNPARIASGLYIVKLQAGSNTVSVTVPLFP